MNRLKKAWQVLWGEDLGTAYPYRFVQLCPFQDRILALSGDGDLYWVHYTYNGELIVELQMKNPVRP